VSPRAKASELVPVIVREHSGALRVGVIPTADLPKWHKGMSAAVEVVVSVVWLDRPWDDPERVIVAPWASWDRPGALRYLTGQLPAGVRAGGFAMIAGQARHVFGADLTGRVWFATASGPGWEDAAGVRPCSLSEVTIG